jgi:hypothetical protein
MNQAYDRGFSDITDFLMACWGEPAPEQEPVTLNVVKLVVRKKTPEQPKAPEQQDADYRQCI